MRRLAWTLSVALGTGCGGSGGSKDVEPGDALSGAWLGCVDEGCHEHTPAGFVFYDDGSLQLIRTLDGERCVNEHPLFMEARWEWRGNQLMLANVLGMDLQLRVRGHLVEVPLHEFEPGAVFHHEALYPTSEWMERVGDSFSECFPAE